MSNSTSKKPRKCLKNVQQCSRTTSSSETTPNNLLKMPDRLFSKLSAEFTNVLGIFDRKQILEYIQNEINFKLVWPFISLAVMLFSLLRQPISKFFATYFKILREKSHTALKG